MDKREIGKSTFLRIVKELLREHYHDLRLNKKAGDILHEASESYMMEIFELANMICESRKSNQITLQDFKQAVLLVNRTTSY